MECVAGKLGKVCLKSGKEMWLERGWAVLRGAQGNP